MSKPKKYLAGPMRGYKQFNFPAFDSAAAYLRGLYGSRATVVNPAEHDREVYPDIESWPGFASGDVDQCPKFSIHDAMRWDLKQVLESDEVFVLPGWEKSTGARHEVTVALTAGIEVTEYRASAPHGCRIGDTVHEVPPPSAAGPKADHETVIAGTVKQIENGSGEVRVTDPNTGGQKGQKGCQIGALDPRSLLEVGNVAGYGSSKYARFNFLKGYDWSLSYDALQRHLHAFWSGEDRDPESGHFHLAHAAWHCLALLSFGLRQLGTDDRPR